jgi:hypothetical protein
VLGPTPVSDAIAQCDSWRALVRGSPLATASTLNPLALLHAMNGDAEAAERLLAEAREILSALGGLTAGVAHLEAWVRLLLGQPQRAEAALRADLESSPGGSSRATTTALLARAVLAQRRVDDAAELCRLAERDAPADDTLTQVLWRGAAARIEAGRGRCADAEALARDAVDRAAATDLLWHHGAAMLDFADVLRACGRSEEADRAAGAGQALYDRKGIAVSQRQGGT